jgi:hypothetical protein
MTIIITTILIGPTFFPEPEDAVRWNGPLGATPLVRELTFSLFLALVLGVIVRRPWEE